MHKLPVVAEVCAVDGEPAARPLLHGQVAGLERRTRFGGLEPRSAQRPWLDAPSHALLRRVPHPSARRASHAWQRSAQPARRERCRLRVSGRVDYVDPRHPCGCRAELHDTSAAEVHVVVVHRVVGGELDRARTFPDGSVVTIKAPTVGDPSRRSKDVMPASSRHEVSPPCPAART